MGQLAPDGEPDFLGDVAGVVFVAENGNDAPENEGVVGLHESGESRFVAGARAGHEGGEGGRVEGVGAGLGAVKWRMTNSQCPMMNGGQISVETREREESGRVPWSREIAWEDSADRLPALCIRLAGVAFGPDAWAAGGDVASDAWGQAGFVGALGFDVALRIFGLGVGVMAADTKGMKDGCADSRRTGTKKSP